jgi:hypothetical protein
MNVGLLLFRAKRAATIFYRIGTPTFLRGRGEFYELTFLSPAGAVIWRPTCSSASYFGLH